MTTSVAGLGQQLTTASKALYMYSEAQWTEAILLTPLHGASSELNFKQQFAAIKVFEEQLQQAKVKVFTSHVRTEANFLRDNDDKELVLPPAYPPERAVHTISTVVLYKLLVASPVIRGA
eukprot:3615048-Prymnesium_polylepis.1